MASLTTLAVALLGLFAPGWLLARALRMPAAWAAAMPLSALTICQSVVVLACLGWRIEFWRVATMLAAVGVAAALAADGWSDLAAAARAAVARLRGVGQDPPAAALIAFVTAIVALFAVRVTLWPLGGWDTTWRWDFLARCLLAERSLDFYPPRTAADFGIYPYPDGLPPLVSSVYWWLYAAVGRPWPAVTAIAVAGQFVSLLGLVHSGADLLWGGRAGWSAAALVAACPLVIWAVGIGQETGYTALSVAGQMACGVAAARSGCWTAAFGCGLFAAIGGLSRDYGPGLSICGLLLLAEQARSRRLLPAFVAGAAIALPWFWRNWWLTGNPVYSNPTPLGLPSNPVHVALIGTYGDVYSVFSCGRREAVHIAVSLAMNAGAVILPGLAGASFAGGRLPLVATAALTAALWAWSTGFTAGGMWYSLRVLSPTMVALALLAPKALEKLRSVPERFRTASRLAGWGVAAVAGVCSVVAAAVFPADFARIPQSGGLTMIPALVQRRRADPLDDHRKVKALVTALEHGDAPDCRILTDNANLAAVLLNSKSRFQPVMVWSPEVWFLFTRVDGPEPERGNDADHGLVVAARRKLAERRIFLAMMSTNVLHWRVLGRMPFFSLDEPTWRPVANFAGDRPDAGIRVMPNVLRVAEP